MAVLKIKDEDGNVIEIPAVKGDKGDKGEDGKSAYEVWLDNGNVGTEQDFLNSLCVAEHLTIGNYTISQDDNGYLVIGYNG